MSNPTGQLAALRRAMRGGQHPRRLQIQQRVGKGRPSRIRRLPREIRENVPKLEALPGTSTFFRALKRPLSHHPTRNFARVSFLQKRPPEIPPGNCDCNFQAATARQRPRDRTRPSPSSAPARTLGLGPWRDVSRAAPSSPATDPRPAQSAALPNRTCKHELANANDRRRHRVKAYPKHVPRPFTLLQLVRVVTAALLRKTEIPSAIPSSRPAKACPRADRRQKRRQNRGGNISCSHRLNTLSRPPISGAVRPTERKFVLKICPSSRRPLVPPISCRSVRRRALFRVYQQPSTISSNLRQHPPSGQSVPASRSLPVIIGNPVEEPQQLSLVIYARRTISRHPRAALSRQKPSFRSIRQ